MVTGVVNLLLLNPKKLPINIKGEVQKSQRTNNNKISENLTAAFDFSIVNTIFTIIYPKTRVPGKRVEVNIATRSQLSPPQKR